MKLDDYRFTGETPLHLSRMPTGSKRDKVKKESILAATGRNLVRLGELQEKLYADGKESVVFVFQAMDAAGKDSAIKHVMGAFNPQGVDVVTFKEPTSEELSHDYLWRAACALPARGKIGIFNRSHYEDVLAVRVRELYKNFQMPARCLEGDLFGRRYRQIREFEEYLYENGCRVVKFFLNVSRAEQKKRFLERINRPDKQWKFSAGDVDDRALWDDYMAAYEDAVNGTATAHSPWYVLPADQKWYTRYLVSEAALAALEDCAPLYPLVGPEEIEAMKRSRDRLLAE